LRGNGTQPGTYTLVNSNGYPTFRGMMTWSINWDAVATCGSTYEYAQNFQNIFGTATAIENADNSEKLFSVFPNPVCDLLHLNISNHLSTPANIRIYNIHGEIVFSKAVTGEKESINISNFPNGVYCLIYDNYRQQIIKQ